MVRYVVAGIVCFFASLPAIADLSNAAPVQSGSHYAVPSVAVYTLGLFGVGVMWFAFTCPKYARPVLLSAGTISIFGHDRSNRQYRYTPRKARTTKSKAISFSFSNIYGHSAAAIDWFPLQP